MKYEKLTQNSREALEYATQLAQSNANPQIECLHLLKGLLAQEDGLTPDLLKEAGGDIVSIMRAVEDEVERLPRVSGGAQVFLSNDLHQALNGGAKYAAQFKDEFVSIEHLLLGLLDQQRDKAAQILSSAGITPDKLLKALSKFRGNQRVTDDNPETKYKVLERYSRDLTALARQGKLDPVIGRDEEIRRVKFPLTSKRGQIA